MSSRPPGQGSPWRGQPRFVRPMGHSVCRVCGRKVGTAESWVAPSGTRACRPWCLDALARGWVMVDATALERHAMDHAGEMAGEFLEATRKLSWKALSRAEWDTLINVICTAYDERRSELIIAADRELAFIRRQHEPDLPPIPPGRDEVRGPISPEVVEIVNELARAEIAAGPSGARESDKDYFRRGRHLRARGQGSGQGTGPGEAAAPGETP